MFDDIIMNMIRNNVFEYCVEGVDSYLPIWITTELICIGGHFKTFTGKVTHESL